MSLRSVVVYPRFSSWCQKNKKHFISDSCTYKAAAHTYQAVLFVYLILFLVYSFVDIVCMGLNCCVFTAVICVLCLWFWKFYIICLFCVLKWFHKLSTYISFNTTDSSLLKSQPVTRESKREMRVVLKLESFPPVKPPLARPHLLNLPRQHHQVGTGY